MADMTTPIADFLKAYAERKTARFHMPGHKGKRFLGIEPYDITEITGADVLYHAEGIIAESEDNASRLFDTAHTFYSTEGSTLAIKAMLSLALTAKGGTARKTILASRGAHKAFLYAAAWLDFDIKWLLPEENCHLCASSVSKEAVMAALSESESSISAVYLTSPDYLGNLCDVKGIANVCREANIPLLVDNAHGAYLAFDDENRHPIALGATMCCDSAHKTLPVLTGGAYLHIAKDADPIYLENARAALASFASTSPSYLIMASLDLCNRYLAEGYRARYRAFVLSLDALKARLCEKGFVLLLGEPLKLTLDCTKVGTTGFALAAYLGERGIECEFYDHDYLVLMATPENSTDDLERLEKVLLAYAIKEPIACEMAPRITLPPVAMTVREAMLSPSEMLDAAVSLGRIAASPTVSCPPAIPIVVSGERITEESVALFKHYGIDTVSVVKE